MPAFFLETFHPLLDRLGRTLTPKCVLVPLLRDPADGMHVWAAYALDQGRRPGRKTDFSGFIRLDGLIVDPGTPPASGVVVFRPGDDEDDLFRLRDAWADGAGVPPLPDGFGADDLDQVLLTNGRHWFALVRERRPDGWFGRWQTRETFASPREWPSSALVRPGTLGASPVVAVFEECVGRALRPWQRLDEPAALGAFCASYVLGAVYAHLHESEPTALRHEYAKALAYELGRRPAGVDREERLAKEMAATAFLDRVAEALARKTVLVLEMVMPQNWRRTFEHASPISFAGIDPAVLAAERLERSADVDAVALFGQAFWSAVQDDVKACAPWNLLPASVWTAHRDGLARRWRERTSRRDNPGNGRLGLLDPHAGTGDLLAAVLDAKSEEAEEEDFLDAIGTVVAVESDPVKFQLLRLRLTRTLVRRVAAGRSMPAMVRLHLGNPLLSPEILTDHLPKPQGWVVLSDLRFSTTNPLSSAPDDQETPSLKRRRQNPLACDPEYPFVRTLDLLIATAASRHDRFHSYFTPERWLETDAFAPLRRDWLNGAGAAWIHRLPANLATNAAARKAGIASVWKEIRSLSDQPKPPEVHAQAIVYAEDIPAAFADDAGLHPLRPGRSNRYSLAPTRTTPGYFAWPSLRELAAAAPLAGPAERRNLATIRMSRDELAEIMRAYFDADISDDEIFHRCPALMTDAPRFPARKTRERLLKKSHFRFREDKITPLIFRPFDPRWAYLDKLRPLLKEPADELQDLSRIPGQHFLIVAEPNDRAPEGLAVWLSPHLCDYDFFVGNSRHFPFHLPSEETSGEAEDKARRMRVAVSEPNLSDRARYFLERLAPTAHDPEEHRRLPELFWYYVLAVLFTPTYQEENREALRRDWPRIPLPSPESTRPLSYPGSTFRFFAQRGRHIAALLDMPPPSTETGGNARALFGGHVTNASSSTFSRAWFNDPGANPGEWQAAKTLAVLSTPDDPRPLAAERIPADQRRLSPRWSVPNKHNAVRPGKMELKPRPYTEKEHDELTAFLHRYNLPEYAFNEVFGPKTFDVPFHPEPARTATASPRPYVYNKTGAAPKTNARETDIPDNSENTTAAWDLPLTDRDSRRHGTVDFARSPYASSAKRNGTKCEAEEELGVATVWRNIPQAIWTMTIGGHPILRKWLSYRGENILRRPLSPAELRHFAEVSQRLLHLRLESALLDTRWPDLRREMNSPLKL